jgi:histidine triad (HIT) family protein
MTDECIFCRIIRGESPAHIVYQDEEMTVFRDIAPKTPVHLLIVPNNHFDSLNQLKEADAELMGRLCLTAARLAEENGIATSGYRLVVNTGVDAGQSVSHLHLHLIGGRHMPVFFG